MLASPSDSYLFDGFEVVLNRRELLGPAGPVTLEPRSFDLLAYLILHRDRVVPKDELLAEVWKTVHNSETVLARGVMKVRRALDEIGADPDLVKTIHRIGYRFTGEPIEKKSETATAHGKRRARVALLPFVNESGDDMLAWVELGLLTIVCRSLDSTTGLSVVPIESLMVTLTPIPAGSTVEQQVATLRNALGVAHVVQVVVRTDLSGAFRLVWRLFSARGSDATGELVGAQLTTLAAELSAKLAEVLLQGESARPDASTFSDNDFLTAAHARALQAFFQHRRTAALDLIKVCIELQPHPVQVEVDFIRILTMSEPARAHVLGRQLLSSMDSGSQKRERTDLLVGLADAALFARDWELCETYVDEAEAGLGEDGSKDNIERIEELRFEIALERGELNLARAIGRSRIARSREEKDMVNLIADLADLAKLELAKGDWDFGKTLMTEAISLDRKFDTKTLASALNNLALTSIWRAQLENVVELLEEAAAANRPENVAILTVATLLNLYTVHSELGNSSEALRAIDEARTFIPLSGSGLLAADGHLVDAQIRFGSLELAYAQSVDALKRLKEIPGLHRTFGLYIIGIISYGSLDEAEAHLTNADPRYADSNATLAHFNFLAAHAHLAYSRQDLRTAQQYLKRYIAVRGSLAGAHDGATNLLWVELDLNELQAAREIAEQVPEHLVNPLRGQICAARLAYEEQSFDQAVRLQRAVALKAEGRRQKGYLDELLRHYENAEATGQHQPIPRPQMLPSMI